MSNTPDVLIDILHNCKLFSKVHERGFQRLAAMARICKFSKGKVIFREGDDCPGTYVVGSGLVRVYKTGPGGKEHVLHMVGPGGTFAEVAAIGGFQSPASAETLSETTCVLLPAEPFQRALQEDHELCLGLMTGMAGWIKHLVGLMEDIVLRDATSRLVRYMLELEPDADGVIELPGLKRHVASHLNLTSETFSRILRRLSQGKLIAEADANRVQLLDLEKLELVAKGMTPEF